jgi:ferredoxin like protein
MSLEPLTIDQRLGLNRYVIDRENNHISINQFLCQDCLSKPCLTFCPAQVYYLSENHIATRYENCLECGTCQIACRTWGKGGIEWRNPQGGFGISYRYG